MGKTRGLIALLAIGGFVVASQAHAANIGVTALKYISIDKETAAGKSKTVYVSKDAAASLSGDDDVDNISVTLDATYTGSMGTATQKSTIPAGASNGTEGWLVVKAAVAKYVNKSAPGGSTGIKVAVIKPGLLLKAIGKNRGDSSVMDLIGADAPTGSVFTAYTVAETSETNSFCTEFTSCSYKIIGGGTGRKLVCKGGIPDGGCTAAGPAPTPAVFEFINGAAGGSCGVTREGGSGGTLIKSLTCGGLNVGGGCFQGGGSCGVAEGPTPSGAVTQLNASCGPTSCALSARTAAQTGSSTNCSDATCQFGTYLSIANGGTSTCVKNTFLSPASGTIDLTTGAFGGSFPLRSAVTLTGNGASPCPDCCSSVCGLASTTPGKCCTVNGDCTGDTCNAASVCDAWAANAGAPCVAANGSGDTYDCVPPGVPLTPFAVDLTPINTGQVLMDTTVDNDQVPGGVAGEFCPGQDGIEPGSYGCFDSGPGTVCDYIEENGTDAGAMSIGGGAAAGTLASVFCIPGTGNGLIDGAADLPGPGATSLPGTFELF